MSQEAARRPPWRGNLAPPARRLRDGLNVGDPDQLLLLEILQHAPQGRGAGGRADDEGMDADRHHGRTRPGSAWASLANSVT